MNDERKELPEFLGQIEDREKKLSELKEVTRKLLDEVSFFNDMRQSSVDMPSTQRSRHALERDYTRVLYSSSFRRLQGKMQLLGVSHEHFFRNRLTHSLEVAQIARSFAYEFGYSHEDIYAIEACALAHDIGNPPFGHSGERVLNEISKDFGGFEGNAQTLRVLTTLEKKIPDHGGLNLTYRTLLGTVKYYNQRSANKDKFIYDNDFQMINQLKGSRDFKLRTIDAQLMDLADEIAYAGHDLEDSLNLRLFTIDELQHELQLYFLENKLSDKEKELLLNTFSSIVENAKEKANKAKTSEEFNSIFIKEITSLLIHILMRDVTYAKISDDFKKKTGSENVMEFTFGQYGKLAKALKTITFRCIQRTDIVQQYELQGERIIRGLFEVLMDTKFNKDCHLMPPEFRKGHNNYCTRGRNVIDYISGMMDSYAIAAYKKLFGSHALSKLYWDQSH
ncbi:deoxyguanosinetriphosphate triphosphohydrolase [Heliomicrobium modesticaldum Ice1]|uniref:Deoxyguanosinetriphosphate triphosphohydrolase n=1 Tax=Heliobacterium modesticaldum (strain ATCC 51547 / Ice1) TaxID=498761 RepID=B0TFY2_HELMI|nr:dNTP triphosphohydrolase [Heliomicrobium modesticaldum]ABZ83139.1 deoxyguanosinetriphosphate triphosphohydrolase [Heliomicrobium modesticaldum Ice1]